ncbi:MAG: YybS family protein [Clostridium sp.]|nr:YybS family protein [Clostridium sp.]
MPTKDSKTQSITYGAMIIAIFGMLLLLNRQTGSFFEEVFLYIFPIPMVAYAAIYGWKRSLPVFVGMCLISFLCGTFTSIFYAISQAFIGLVFGTSLNHHREMTRTLLMVMVLSALANILSTVVLATLFGYNITAEVTAMQQGMHESLQKALEFSGGTSNPQNVQTMEAMKSILTFDYMKRMFILSMVFFGAIQGFVVYQLSLVILRRLRFPVEKPKPLIEYFPPRWIGYVALALFAAYYFTTLRPLDNEFLQNAAQTLGMCGMLFLFLFGVIAANQAVKAWITPNKLLAVILTAVALMTFPMVVIILGYLYISAGFHDHITAKLKKNEKAKDNLPPPRAF